MSNTPTPRRRETLPADSPLGRAIAAKLDLPPHWLESVTVTFTTAGWQGRAFWGDGGIHRFRLRGGVGLPYVVAADIIDIWVAR